MEGNRLNLAAPWKDHYLVALVARAKTRNRANGWFHIGWDDRVDVLRSKRLLRVKNICGLWYPSMRFTKKGHRQIVVPIVVRVADTHRNKEHRDGLHNARVAIKDYLFLNTTAITVAQLQPKILGLVRRLNNYKQALKRKPLSYNAAITIYRSTSR